MDSDLAGSALNVFNYLGDVLKVLLNALREPLNNGRCDGPRYLAFVRRYFLRSDLATSMANSLVRSFCTSSVNLSQLTSLPLRIF